MDARPSFYVGSDPTNEILRGNLKSERDRVLTFTGWPNQLVQPRDLARAGFYFTRREDNVRCAFCGLQMNGWNERDDPMTNHTRWASYCPFVQGLDVGNVPLGPDEVVEVPNRGEDICGRYGIQVRPSSLPERANRNVDLSGFGVVHKYTPTYPKYTTLEARIRTFKDWPLAIKQTSEELAGAGFFYTGKGDQAMCFSCGGGLKDWLEGDDPWEQHARWFTKCSFVLMVKGHEFIREVSNRLPVTAQQGASSSPSTSKSAPGTSTSGKPASVHQRPSTSRSCEPVLHGGGNSSKQYDDGRLCKICYTEELGVVFLPCGHIVACVKCVQSLSTCSVCRKPFTATVRAFLS